MPLAEDESMELFLVSRHIKANTWVIDDRYPVLLHQGVVLDHQGDFGAEICNAARYDQGLGVAGEEVLITDGQEQVLCVWGVEWRNFGICRIICLLDNCQIETVKKYQYRSGETNLVSPFWIQIHCKTLFKFQLLNLGIIVEK